MFKIIIKYLVWLVIILIVAGCSYYKGCNDYRLRYVIINMGDNYALLRHLDDGRIKGCRSELILCLNGENKVYQELSTNILLYNLAINDSKLTDFLKEIGLYIKEHPTNNALLDQNMQK